MKYRLVLLKYLTFENKNSSERKLSPTAAIYFESQNTGQSFVFNVTIMTSAVWRL
jgi:hypothetical protein